jgi:hypothetical protein
MLAQQVSAPTIASTASVLLVHLVIGLAIYCSSSAGLEGRPASHYDNIMEDKGPPILGGCLSIEAIVAGGMRSVVLGQITPWRS